VNVSRGLHQVKSANGIDRLYIFVTSANPDPYINVLVYAIRHFKLGLVCFISVQEHEYRSEDDAAGMRLQTVVSRIDDTFQNLSGGSYLKERQSDQVDISPVPIDSSAAEMYRACLQIWEDQLEISRLVVHWRDLDEKLRSFAADGHGIFDVTALKKNLLVDVVALLLSRGCTRIFEFEIVNKERSYDERDLIHSLTEVDKATEGTFIYRNLTESPHLASAERRMLARSVTFRMLILVTAIVAAIVLIVQIFLPSSWFATAILAAATTAAIAGWLYPLLRRD
jgi:hypothetical protein